MAVCVLRFANILGPQPDSPLADYLALPVLPTVLGYDPRLQFVHEDDVVDVLEIAAREPRRGTLNSGTFNIAGDGVLLLSQCSRRLGRPTVPVLLPAVTWVGSALRTIGMTDFSPEQIRLLTHGRVVSTVQMRETLGFRPKFTTAGTFAEFARSRGPGLLPPERVGRAVGRLAELPIGGGGQAGDDTFDSRRQVEERDRRWRTPRSFRSTTTVRAPARGGAEARCRAAAGTGRPRRAVPRP